ncbi:protein ImuB [Nocardia sp. GAS34]|uniref:DNA polymerase Y family protein n=1 Tax=unclassified Nocardia TaxID=2637762 RepID=UPI003D1D478E
MRARGGSRVLAVWCQDWPAVAAGAAANISPSRPVVVLHANRVVACSEAARAQGVRRGLRRREAQARCPDLYVAQSDPDRDARLFEPVVAAVDATVPGVEVLRPGLLVLAARGAARFFGSEESAAERLVDAVAVTGIECRIGIADELSTAVLAARRAALVPPGEGARFLAPRPVSELAVEPSLAGPGRDDLVDLLHRLGLRRIGDFAALTPAEVASRFGADAIAAHRCARAEPERPPSAAAPAPDLAVEYPCDPPIERVDAAAFAGRLLAARLHERLAAASSACTRLTVIAHTAAGERLARTWRCAEPLTPETTADRIRWQLDGWLTHRALHGAAADDWAGIATVGSAPEGGVSRPRGDSGGGIATVGAPGAEAPILGVSEGGARGSGEEEWTGPAAIGGGPRTGGGGVPQSGVSKPRGSGAETGSETRDPGEGEWAGPATIGGGAELRGDIRRRGAGNGGGASPAGEAVRRTEGGGRDGNGGGRGDSDTDAEELRTPESERWGARRNAGADGRSQMRRGGAVGGAPAAPIVLLRLEPVEVVAAGALQLGLWGGVGEEQERARRALVRVQGLLGGEAVQVGMLSGGRGPLDRITLIALGDEQNPAADPALPWPGRLPEPAPAVVLINHPPVSLETVAGEQVWVTDRGVFTAEPGLLRWGSKQWEVTGWAGPWLLDERWWAGEHPGGYAVRAQVLLDAAVRALLLLGYDNAWHVEGLYE